KMLPAFHAWLGKENTTTFPCRNAAISPVASDLSWTSDQEIAEHQGIHFCAQETIQGFLRTANDRLVVVERGIQYHRHTGLTLELADQRMIAPIRFRGHGLQTPSAVYMRGRGNLVSFFRPHGVSQRHKRRWMRLVKPLACFFRQNRRRKRPEYLPVLDALVQNLFHLRAPGVGHNAPVAERAGSPFGAALIPPQDFSFGNNRRSAAHQ